MLLKNIIKQFLGIMILPLCLISCGSSSNSGIVEYNYLAVQVEDGDNWSIMDSSGKVVVKEEYSPKDEISIITPSGVYWVKSGIDDKFRLYSIDSPKKPITSEEYTYVTIFIDGKAFVSDGENPIQVIDTKGNVKKKLPREIRCVVAFDNVVSDMIAYVDKNSNFGYLDTDGNIVIEAQYDEAWSFSDGVALVSKKDDKSNKYYIIGENGKVKGEVDLDRYEVIQYNPIFTEGKLAVKEKADYNKLLYLGRDGKVALELSKKYEDCGYYSNYFGGYAVVEDKDGNEGIINDKGEFVIRMGKYDHLYNLKNGTFIVGNIGAKGKYGIVDGEDNVIIDADYSGGLLLMLGENYVMQDGSDYLLVDANGNEIKNSQFQNISASWYKQTISHDIKQIAADLVAQIETKGYTPILGKRNIKDIANVFNQKVEDQPRGKKYMDLPSFKADVYDVEVSLGFNERTLYEKTHKEVVNDGWFAHEKTISDGWFWNEDAMLEDVHFFIDNLHEDVNVERLSEEIFEALKKKGFKYAADGYYEAKNGDIFAGVGVTPGYKEISVTFYPYKEYSENQFE